MYERKIHWPFVQRNWFVSSQPVLCIHNKSTRMFSLVLNGLSLYHVVFCYAFLRGRPLQGRIGLFVRLSVRPSVSLSVPLPHCFIIQKLTSAVSNYFKTFIRTGSAVKFVAVVATISVAVTDVWTGNTLTVRAAKLSRLVTTCMHSDNITTYQFTLTCLLFTVIYKKRTLWLFYHVVANHIF